MFQFLCELGFRFVEEKTNLILENWLKKGGQKFAAPEVEGLMYLPKSNIEKCLNYGQK